MSPPRFYCPQLARSPKLTEARYFLEAAEARHATSVLRLHIDDALVLFDGQGRAALARVLEAKRDTLGVEITEWLEPPPEIPVELTLAIALPKGDRQKTLVDAATELGVSRLVPILCQRGVAQPTDNALDRLRRQVIEACKQSGRNRLMQISNPLALDELAVVTRESNMLRLVAHPYEVAGIETKRQALMSHLQGPLQNCWMAIGPEGGFTDAEVAQLVHAGWNAVDLGPLVLRIEIAAMAAIAQVTGWFYGSSWK